MLVQAAMLVAELPPGSAKDEVSLALCT